MTRIDKKSTRQIFSYGTSVPVARTIEEIRALLAKYNANESFAHVDQPEAQGGSYIAFVITTRFGRVPIRVNVPKIYVQNKYYERESYRNVLLLIKSKLIEVDCGEPIEHVFLANMPDSWREKLLPRMNDLPLLEGHQ